MKREAYRRAFHNFDVDRVAAMGPQDVERLLAAKKQGAAPADNVVLHRGKLQSVLHNAKLVQQLRVIRMR